MTESLKKSFRLADNSSVRTAFELRLRLSICSLWGRPSTTFFDQLLQNDTSQHLFKLLKWDSGSTSGKTRITICVIASSGKVDAFEWRLEKGPLSTTLPTMRRGLTKYHWNLSHSPLVRIALMQRFFSRLVQFERVVALESWLSRFEQAVIKGQLYATRNPSRHESFVSLWQIENEILIYLQCGCVRESWLPRSEKGHYVLWLMSQKFARQVASCYSRCRSWKFVPTPEMMSSACLLEGVFNWTMP